jgi:membrane protein DedA with SNARE-associated domain
MLQFYGSLNSNFTKKNTKNHHPARPLNAKIHLSSRAHESFDSRLLPLLPHHEMGQDGQLCYHEMILLSGSSLIFPTDLASFLELLRLHGDEAYGLIFAFAASHSLLLTLFAGYASSSGSLDLGTLVAVVWAGSFLGDTIRFGIGRFFGTQWLSAFPRLQRTSQIVVRLVDRYYVWLILFHRYPHGIRGVAGFAYGMSRLSWPTFLAFNFVAAGIWSGAVLTAGHAFGQISEKLLNDAFSGIGMIMLIVFLALSWVLSKKLERVAEQS